MVSCLKFADKDIKTQPLSNFSYLQSPEKQMQTWTNLTVNIQHMLWQNSHRRQKKKTFTSSCPLKHNANGQGRVERSQTLFSSVLSLFAPAPCIFM